ncbi:MAG: hypothetical protein GWO20_19135 [Candidatus Korarchaeota archaeon]|nr:hypothetical protein [Candidatus Korarchaeota archaeon]NIU85371.1 hypothetical protein [Candidatus Thorarchaeota archaeon]NIW15469.1 hypothetical protein [Candidatus Thorarchaeota archaeon]NIW53413.1 hypothetical protein [Candidatus Korarchaeota archaeon]
MKVAILSFDCEKCGKHNDLVISLKKLKKQVDDKKIVSCQYCGAEKSIPSSIEDQLRGECEEPKREKK